MRREDRSSIVVSNPLADLGRRQSRYIIDSSPSLEQFLCSRLTPFLRPDLCVDNRAVRRDGQGWPSLGLAYPASALPGHALTGPSTGRRHLSVAGRLIGLLAFEVAVITEMRTAQAIRASLLASAMASTLGCSRLFAAVIHCLSP